MSYAQEHHMMKCRFCDKSLIISMYALECKDCHVKYLATHSAPTWSNWHYIRQTYQLQDPEYILHALTMDFEKKESTLWIFTDPGHILSEQPTPMKRATFAGISIDTKPEDALTLARRYHRLLVFI
jgi:hypothetical protein